MSTIIPKQKRSIEKRNKIITAGFKLFAEKGFYNVTADEIAKEAGVSTGIAYRYFEDKKDILIESIKYYLNNINYNWEISEIDFSSETDTKKFLNTILDEFIKVHKKNIAIHEQFEIMRRADKDVGKLYEEFIELSINKVTKFFKNYKNSKCNCKPSDDKQEDTYSKIADHAYDKILYIIKEIENFCHMYVIEFNEKADYNFLRNLCINNCYNVLKQI